MAANIQREEIGEFRIVPTLPGIFLCTKVLAVLSHNEASLKLRKICFHHYKCKYCICLSALAFRWNGAAPASPWIAVQEKSLKGMVFCQTPTSKNISACVRVTN